MKTYKEFIVESTRRRGERYDSSQGFDYHSNNPNLSITRKKSGMQTTITDKTSGVTFKIGHGDPKYSKYTDPDLQNTIHSNKPTLGRILKIKKNYPQHKDLEWLDLH